VPGVILTNGAILHDTIISDPSIVLMAPSFSSVVVGAHQAGARQI
jgi:hypothetical protein